tara:strand:- start:57 stop:824 length:768 start_codon:yes stop_codon:yes gene_type:complete
MKPMSILLVPIVALLGATSVQQIPGLSQTTDPEARQILQRSWAMQQNAPSTVQLRMHGTSLGHAVRSECWIGGGNIVTKVVLADGDVMVEGDIDDTAFKIRNGKPVVMSATQKMEQYLRAHPHMAVNMMLNQADGITVAHGKSYGRKVSGLVLHGLPHGNVVLNYYDDGTLASQLEPMAGHMGKAVFFGNYKEIDGHPVPGRVDTWIVHIASDGSWSTHADSSRHLSRLELVDATLNQPIPAEIFTKSHWLSSGN